MLGLAVDFGKTLVAVFETIINLSKSMWFDVTLRFEIVVISSGVRCKFKAVDTSEPLRFRFVFVTVRFLPEKYKYNSSKDVSKSLMYKFFMPN